MLTFFKTILLSSINPFYFRTLVRKSFFSAFFYYLFFTFLHGIVIAGLAVYYFQNHRQNFYVFFQKQVPHHELHLRGGELSTTLPQPITFGDKDMVFIF